MMYIIDRVEGLIAVLEDEDGEFRNVPAASLPEDAREGDIVIETEQGLWERDVDATDARREKIRALEDHLRRFLSP